MNAPSSEQSTVSLRRLADELRARLRFAQADLADESSDDRAAQLREIIHQGLEAVHERERAELLGLVRDDFADPASCHAPDTAFSTEHVPRERLVDHLLDEWHTIPESERQRLVDALGPAPTAARAGDAADFGLDPGVIEEVRLCIASIIGARPSDQIDIARALELLAYVLEAMLSMESLSDSTWRKFLGGQSSPSPSNLRDLARRFLTRDPSLDRDFLESSLNRSRQLAAALIAATGAVGGEFARRHLQRFAPEAIEEAAGTPGAFENRRARCWDHYLRLMQHTDERAIRGEIEAAIVSQVEPLIRRSVPRRRP